MIKKLLPIFIIVSVFVGLPMGVFAERLIASPKLFTVETAPYSAKPKSSAKKSVKRSILKLGMRGSDVLALQQFLIKKSAGPAALALAKNKATGYFGELTKDALKEFQEAKGLTVDGIAGAKVFAQYNK